MRFLVLIILLAAPAQAADYEKFLGTWGTVAECARAPLKPGGTRLAEPVEISKLWLKQGQLWCALNWGPIEPREGGAFTAATAQCGEDSVRAYFLGLLLAGEDLTLRWDFTHLDGPLRRCPGS